MSEEQQIVEDPTVLRTADSGTFEIYNGLWGSYLRPCFDPDANVVITKENLEHFEVREDINKIPAELWSRWIRLCFHFVNKGSSQLEVSIRFLQNIEDPTKYMAIVPRQSVTLVTVDVSKLSDSIDLTTGEKVTTYPPAGWNIVGSSHSHHTMSTGFSSRDDEFELGDPGFHIIVGQIDQTKATYHINASVVGNGRRFFIPYDKLIDTTPINEVDFHPDVLTYVDCSPPKPKYLSPATTYGVAFNKKFSNWKNKQTTSYDQSLDWYDNWENEEWYGKRWIDGNSSSENPLNDPFFVSDNGISNFNYNGDTTEKEIADISSSLNEYILFYRDNTDALEELQQSLSATLIELQMVISQ
jgi:hypothetical protein